jgi:arginase
MTRPPTHVRVFSVPFDAGSEGVRMGAGPEALLAAGLVERISASAAAVDVVRVGPTSQWRSELQTTFELHRRLAELTRQGLAEGARPLILAGDCNMTVAAIAAHDPGPRTGVVWLDAHADLNTPETDLSGYLDGQDLAMLTGRCWAGHTRSLDGFSPVPGDRVLLVGARAIDELERDVLADSGIARMSATDASLLPTRDRMLHEFTRGLDQVHLHVDVDVLDTSVGRPNSYAAPGGMQVDDVVGLIEQVGRSLPVVSSTLASWDPALDDGRISHAALRIAAALASTMI